MIRLLSDELDRRTNDYETFIAKLESELKNVKEKLAELLGTENDPDRYVIAYSTTDPD